MRQARILTGSLIFALWFICNASASPPQHQKLQAVKIHQVGVADGFWAPRIEINRKTTLDHAFRKVDEYGNLANFAKAAGLIPGRHRGSHAYDSDVYKIIEGAAYTLHHHPDKELEKFLDLLIDNIAAAQQPDGYLSTSFILDKPEEKWTNVRREHEMYCAGHLFEAAVAYFEATGKKKLLNVAVRLADHIDSIFGPGKRYDVPGHEEIELALIKLSHTTGEKRYFDLAKFFLDERGHAHGSERRPFDSTGLRRHDTPPENREERLRRIMIRNGRMQDHKPVIEQTKAIGHAVRAGYLYAAMTDVAAIAGDSGYTHALTQIWEDIVGKKIYITGGVGTAQYFDEGFGDPYRLPNERAYSETCAQAANVLWNHRMNLLHGDAKYIDVLELSLYNALLSGVSLSGDRFFYRNTLACSTERRRQDWFDPACCPSNVVRLFPQIRRFVYSLGTDTIHVNLFIAGKAALPLKGQTVHITQETRYPWDGRVEIAVDPERPERFSIKTRIPSWGQGRPLPSDLYRYAGDKKPEVGIRVNSQEITSFNLEKGYVRLERRWEKGDRVEVDLPMPVRTVHAHPRIEADRGRIALMRGPIVYCLEEVDNPAFFQNQDTVISFNKSGLTPEFRADLLGGIVILKGKARIKPHRRDESETVEIQAVPYYSWNNRGPGKMLVWMLSE